MFKRGLIQLATKKYNMNIISPFIKKPYLSKIDLPGKFNINLLQSRKITEYQKQLEIKRVVKNYYGVNKNHKILELESRLDVILFRLYFVRNLDEGRDWIKKGKVKVNNKVVINLNFKVTQGSSITIEHTKSASNIYFRSILPNFKLPSYLILKNHKEALVIRKPNTNEFTYPINFNLNKYYSR